MDTKEKLALKTQLAKDGFVIKEIGQWPVTATYYNREGIPLPNMPADPYSMKRYLGRGFTLVQPEKVEPSNGNGLKCECGFIAKDAFGLTVHKRRHQREINKEGE